MKSEEFPNHCDVLVVGAGAAGLTAALVAASQGLTTLIVEKTDLIGGTTAYSGGVIWVPNSRQATSEGIVDTPQEALQYLDTLIPDPADRARRQAYIETASEALSFIESHSDVRFVLVKDYPDYHPDVPGSALGRALSPAPFDARQLTIERFEQIRPPRPDTMLFGKMMIDRADLAVLLRPWLSFQAGARALGLLSRYVRDRLRRSRGAQLRSGNALVARLILSLDKQSVPISLSTPLVRLIREGDRIQGAVVCHQGQEKIVKARLGVILATGGFASNADMRERLAGRNAIPLAVASEGNTGDGARAATAVGGKLDEAMTSSFFMFPSSVFRDATGRSTVWPHLTFADRAKPGLIAVDDTGRRFVNEASSYQVFSQTMLDAARFRLDAAFYLICDRSFVYKYGLGVVRPFAIGLRRHIKNGYVIAESRIELLAKRIGINLGEFQKTLEEYNLDAARGVDAALGKGGNIYNRYNGDRSRPGNPCLAPLNRPPFFALRVQPGAFGSAVGLKTDADARVIGDNGQPIGGLYAVGNDMASIMRGTYPGPGITIGPAMVFAYRAVEHLRHPSRSAVGVSPDGLNPGDIPLTD